MSPESIVEALLLPYLSINRFSDTVGRLLRSSISFLHLLPAFIEARSMYRVRVLWAVDAALLHAIRLRAWEKNHPYTSIMS